MTTDLFTTNDAVKRRDEIKLSLTTITKRTSKLADLIEAAQAAEDHLVLGYDSWISYITEEFEGLLGRMHRELRRAAIQKLTTAGMSSRAIAEELGVSQATVSRDQRQVSQNDSPAAPEPPRVIHGRDQKSYPRPIGQQKPRQRRPLPDAYRDALYDLEKVVERLQRLHADDRFERNQPDLREYQQNRLDRVTELLIELNDDLSGWLHCHECRGRVVPAYRPGDDPVLCEACSGAGDVDA